MCKFQSGFTSLQIIFSILVGTVLLGGVAGGVLYFAKQPSWQIEQGKCGDGICDDIEKKNNICAEDCKQKTESQQNEQSQQQKEQEKNEQPQQTINQQSSNDNSIDADGFLWGTEAYMTMLESEDSKQKEISAINNTLKVKNLKARMVVNLSSDGKTFSNILCLPSVKNCIKKYDTDKFVQIFKENGWSMRPMFSLPTEDQETPFSDGDIDTFVDYVDWFIARYKNDANIKAIELFNAPAQPVYEKTLTIQQLLTAQNKTYDRIKNKYPEILVGTHGFEYQFDALFGPSATVVPTMTQMVDYFLDKNNGAKFDYWAFHGYSSYDSPVKTAVNNKYAGVPGILEIRKKLDANGWQNRPIIDTEHTSLSANRALSDAEDKIDAAHMVQELTIKKSLKYNNKFVLSGITPLKIIPRGSLGEQAWGSLLSSGTTSKLVKATALLLSKFNEYNYVSRISGEFDNSDKVWVEKFQSGANKEMYIFFKPISIQTEILSQTLDKVELSYNLALSAVPKKISLTDINGNISEIAPAKNISLKAVNSPKYLEVNY